jgi:hypothetical protein
MISVYSPFGCSPDFFSCQTDQKIGIIIDPNKNYFDNKIIEDRNRFDKMILIHGMEPKQLNNITNEVIKNYTYFDKILSSYPEVLNNCNNSEFFLCASSWILTKEDKTQANFKSEYFNIFTIEKNFELSYVMSNKKFLPGHFLRHQLKDEINKKRKYHLNFPPSIPTNEKYKLFEKSMFHIAIENTKNINYISEKILDCFMSYTIPIYWGCPNISDYFNPEGIIIFENKEELITILDNLTEEDFFKRKSAILENYKIASEKYSFFFDRVNDILDKMTK